jgi:hypothetical protein
VASVPSLRASDSDREQVAERLRHATAEGRLSTDELEERVGALYGARTYGELDALVADLPVANSPARLRDGFPQWTLPAGAVALVLGLLGLLAGADRHPGLNVGDPRHHRQLGFPGPDAHHGVIVAASTVSVLVVLVICAALVWLLLGSRPTPDA